jgi:hypothetical protein
MAVMTCIQYDLVVLDREKFEAYLYQQHIITGSRK